MEVRSCCAAGCRCRSHDHLGRRIPTVTVHPFPSWRSTEGALLSALTRRRRAAWVEAVGRSGVTFDHVPSSVGVCSRHFQSGKPANDVDVSDPDWVPSLRMGRSDGNQRHTLRPPPSESMRDQDQRPPPGSTSPQTRPPEGGDTQNPKPAGSSWSEVKALLHLALRHLAERPEDESPRRAAADGTTPSFRDFFRRTLEAALEASSRSRVLAAQQPPALTQENQASKESSSSSSSSSSSCLNCVTLKARITELQERLEKTGDQDHPEKTRLQPDPGPQTRIHHILLSPGWTLRLGDQDPERLAAPPAGSQGRVVKLKPRTAPRFRQPWLKKFWFLRYSESLDQMWCHVCRLHADPIHQNLPLIRGSRIFKIHSLKIHQHSKYHQQNEQRHRRRQQGRRRLL